MWDDKLIQGPSSCILFSQAVAIKVVPISFLSSDIQRETDIMRDLDSPNVVKLIEVLRTDNNFYIMTELCNGGDLKEYMRIHVQVRKHFRVLSVNLHHFPY